MRSAVAPFVAFLAALTQILPWGALRRAGSFLGAFVGSVIRYRRAEVEARLARAGFPASAATRMYQSLGAGLMELLWLSGRKQASALAHVRLSERARAALSQLQGRGAIIASAHVGNWDLVASAIAAERPIWVMTKRLSDLGLDRRWRALRAERGVLVASGEGAIAECRGALRKGALVGMMIDQAPLSERAAVSFPFLGEAAWHDLLPALMAARARVPFIVAWGARLPDGTHLIDVPMILPAPRCHAEVVEATRAASACLEARIRERPWDWLWLHRRWKHVEGRGTRAGWTTSSASVISSSARASS